MKLADAFDVRRTLRRDLEQTVADNIRAHLTARGMSETELGRSIGLSQAAISRRFVGLSKWEDHELKYAAEVLGTTLTVLVSAPGPLTGRIPGAD